MDGTDDAEDAEDPKESLPPPGQPFRPWRGSGTHQPGADRPRSAVPAPRPVPQPDLTAPRYVPTPAVPRPPRAGSIDGGPAQMGLVLALVGVAAATAWMPWAKLPATGAFEFSGRGLHQTANAWDAPARYLWSFRSGNTNGLELGWFVVGLAVLMAVACFRSPGTGTVRVLAALETGVAALFIVQTIRLDNALPSPTFAETSFVDFTGIGVYVLLVVSLAIVVVARR